MNCTYRTWIGTPAEAEHNISLKSASGFRVISVVVLGHNQVMVTFEGQVR